MKRRLLYPLVALLLAVLTACAQVGVQPTTFNGRMLAAYSTVEHLRTSTRTLLVSGALSKADAQNVQLQTESTVQALDLIRTMHATDPAGATTKLNATVTVLGAIQAYLLAKEQK